MKPFQICGLLGYYLALSGSSVPTFRDNLSVPSSKIKMWQLVPKRRYRTTTERCVISQESVDVIFIAAEVLNHAKPFQFMCWCVIRMCWRLHIQHQESERKQFWPTDQYIKDIYLGRTQVHHKSQKSHSIWKSLQYLLIFAVQRRYHPNIWKSNLTYLRTSFPAEERFRT
jgi:hypothetical protein